MLELELVVSEIFVLLELELELVKLKKVEELLKLEVELLDDDVNDSPVELLSLDVLLLEDEDDKL